MYSITSVLTEITIRPFYVHFSTTFSVAYKLASIGMLNLSTTDVNLAARSVSNPESVDFCRLSHVH